MADVFVSYASTDRDRVRSLVEAIEARGYSVWWDARIDLGSSFDREIEKELESASAAIVVWSEASVDSDWVRDEAGEAMERDILLPVRIDGCRIPLGFRRAQTADLHGWPSTESGLDLVLARLAELTGEASKTPTLIGQGAAKDEIVVAVLAFANLNDAEELDGVCDGIAEEIINALMNLPGLRVPSSTDTFRFKGGDIGTAEIGRQLGAELVLEGSLQKAEGRYAVGARLVKVADGHAIWSERINRPERDIFALQDEVARHAVDGLRSELGFYRSPEALIVEFAKKGDGDAFAELVKRRQSWIRNLMRRFCGDATLADDLAQQAFLQAWRTIGQLRRADRFGPWLKRLAVNVWLQHLRRNDALRDADEFDDDAVRRDSPGIAMDLNRALAELSEPVRMCIVLSYHEGMTHGEIADLTEMPLGTVKSHIRRGTARLKVLLAAYAVVPEVEEAT
jgi:RNA polymerase sigma factor (sigma-70 family)